jgi:TRAP-type C4-dicarboxylate transport system substrate-binding protein
MKKWKKTTLSTFFALTLALSLAACGSETTTTPAPDNSSNTKGSNEAKQEEVSLTASSGISAQHSWQIGFFNPFMERVEKESDGAVSFKVFTSGELVSLGTEYDALRQGQIDVALTFMAPYDPKRFPYSEVTMLPLLKSDAKIASSAMQTVMKSDREIADGKTYYQLEFEDKGLVAFANPLTEPYVMATTKTKLETVEDFTESIRLRSPSRVHEILAANLGLTSISMPVTDAYDALSRNALDGMFHSVPDWISFGVDELLKHTIEGVNLGHFLGHTAMTKETWDKLSPEVQESMKKATDEIIFDGAEVWIAGTVKGKESNISKGGEFTHFNDLDPAVQDHINKALVDTWFAWIENLESQNLAGKEMAILWRDAVIEAGGEVPQEIMDLK